MTRLNRHDRAKEHFMEALSLDVKCFDAFHELTNGNLLGVDEGKVSHLCNSFRTNLAHF